MALQRVIYPSLRNAINEIATEGIADERPHLEEDDLLLFADGSLEEERIAPVQRHLSCCPLCERTLADAELLLAALAGIQKPRSVKRHRAVANAAGYPTLMRTAGTRHIN